MPPAVNATAQRLYDRLPEFMRTLDAGEDWTMLQVLDAATLDFAVVEAVIDSWLEDGALFDAELAEVGWLEFVAQHVGVYLEPALTEAEKRDAVQYASAGWRAGTRDAVKDAARTALTGTKHVEVYDHSVTSPGDGDEWDVLLVTRASETPDVPAVLATIVAKGAKPAGVVLHHRSYSSSWSSVAAVLPTWNDWAGVTWNQLEETGL